MSAVSSIGVRNYALVTGAYWGFTLTDGALRMLVLLHFHRLGYSPVQLAFHTNGRIHPTVASYAFVRPGTTGRSRTRCAAPGSRSS